MTQCRTLQKKSFYFKNLILLFKKGKREQGTGKWCPKTSDLTLIITLIHKYLNSLWFLNIHHYWKIYLNTLIYIYIYTFFLWFFLSLSTGNVGGRVYICL